MRVFAIYIATCSLFCTTLALREVHKHMNVDELRSVFHVEDHSAVPEYELVELNHHGILHSIHKRSIQNSYDVDAKQSHHVKKDLSKSPYYSELKLALSQHGANSLSDENFREKLKNLDLSQIKEHNVSFSAFGDVLNLTLKPVDGLFKDGPKSLRIWTARSDPNATQGVQYEEIVDDAENPEHVGEIFQDEKNMAAILMRRHIETGDLIMEGSIGHELVIKPIPKNVVPKDDGVQHVIYKRVVNANDQMSDFAFMEPDRLEKRYRERRSVTLPEDQNAATHEDALMSSSLMDNDDKGSKTNMTPTKKRSRRDAPYVIYPEILVIVDYDGYRLHGGDNLQVKRYFVSFWNGVDLRYRLLKGPRIRISIAGIIISRGRDATPYLERNRVGRDAIDSAAALTDMGKYLFRERRLPVYDIAVAITKLDMCRRLEPYGECKRGTAGFAYVGGACVVNKRLEKVNSVAIIEDTGGFSGIIVAAHEVGHLLGAVHDGSPPPSYLGGPGAEKCRWEDGYIMSDLRHTERGFRWSSCTVQSFHHFLNGDTASCLHNAPHEDEALGRALPGTLLSLDAQCRRDRGTYACFKDDRVCAQLFCFDSLTGYCVAYRPAAEGSACGNGLHCLDGRCVQQQQQNAIPNYTQDGGFSNLYRPVFNEEYDEIEDTTVVAPSSTSQPVKSKKRIYYRSTTPQTSSSSSYDRSIDDYINSSPVATDNPSDPSKPDKNLDSPKSRYTTFTTPATTSTTAVPSTSTTKQTTSINPFYFGFPKFTTTTIKPQTQNINSRFHKPSTTEPTKSPPFNYFSYLNNNNNNNNAQTTIKTFNNNYFNLQTTTPKATTTTVRPTTNYLTTHNYNQNSNYNNNNAKYGANVAHDLFFNSYLKKLKTTTRNPYNFDNLAEYYRTTSTLAPPPYSFNYLGDNSNRLPLGLWFA